MNSDESCLTDKCTRYDDDGIIKIQKRKSLALEKYSIAHGMDVDIRGDSGVNMGKPGQLDKIWLNFSDPLNPKSISSKEVKRGTDVT